MLFALKEPSSSMRGKSRFFPRDVKFWSLHFGGLLLFLFIDFVLGSILADKPRILGFEVLSFAVWSIGFTMSVLTLRAKYTLWSQADGSMGTLVVRLVSLVMLLAMGIFLAIAVISMPPYWDILLAQELAVKPSQTSSGYIFELLVGNTFTGAIILSCWLSFYIGIGKTREVKQSKITNLRLQNSLKEAQLSSLSNQLNPHFLFNSLNNIRFMIHENADQADEMITSLSQVLRYSLESSLHEKRPLSKEMEIISRYVEIVSLQFEERFQFSMDIPNKLHNILIPPMLLQMLIENAVKHGVERLQQGSRVVVSAVIESEVLQITVINDAPVKDKAHGHLRSGGTGIGLDNIEQRLRLLYGKHAHFSAELIGGKFRVSISLPIEIDSRGAT